MNRFHCISNRNVGIVAAYVRGKLGTHSPLFEDLPYPAEEYPSPEHFFLNEDEWTTYENFDRIFRKAKALVNEPDFFFKCGASAAGLRSWGRFHYFVRVFATPSDGFKRLPFFNKNFNDTKDVEIVSPPAYDRRLGKIKSTIKVQIHENVDPNADYIRDPYLQGIISSIPTIWGLNPAEITRVMNPYNPEVLFNREPEFTPFALNAKMEGELMTIRDPMKGHRTAAGRRVLMEPENLNGRSIFLGKYINASGVPYTGRKDRHEAVLITDTVSVNNQILLRKGEIYMAPYFIFEVTYDRISVMNRLSAIMNFKGNHRESGKELSETIDQLRKSMRAKNEAYEALKKSNLELMKSKAQLDDYARELEHKVALRTKELRRAQQELITLNRSLKSKVDKQLVQLQKYDELRRYLSPKLAERILNNQNAFPTGPRRKMMTVLFSDIRGFSDMTDSLEAEELFYLLERYLAEMIEAVHQHDGTLNKIIGDGLLAFFGDPVPMEDHALQAVKVAIHMQRRTAKLVDEWRKYGHELGIGVGINTGYMTVGNIGSNIHRDYTVIGNQVNAAARLESTAGAGQILIGQRTYSRVKDLVEVEEIGEIKVKGIHTPIKTYNVLW